jgi:putative ABC transport system substrate-binding protein
MTGKWLTLLKEIAPGVVRAAPLYNPQTATYAPLLLRSLLSNAATRGVNIEPAPVQSPDDIDRAISALGDKPDSGLIVLPDGFMASHRDRIIGPATRHGVPAIYPYTFFVREGGLISYGVVLSDLYRRGAEYIDRILQGTKPSNLPVQAPAKFEMALNLKTAKALGLSAPLTLQETADEVIE